MKNEIYNIIRPVCISDIAAENAAEKVVEYLENKKNVWTVGHVVGHVDSLIHVVESIKESHPERGIVIVCTEKNEERTFNGSSIPFAIPEIVWQDRINTEKHTHKRKSSREI